MKHKFKAPKRAKKKKEEKFSLVSLATNGGLDDALVLCVGSPIKSWVLDLGVSFHSTTYKELLRNFMVGEYGKIYLADGRPLDIAN